MMGNKAGHSDPIDRLTLAERCSRHLERALDLSFARELVADSYAAGGHPSIDPVVFCQTQDLADSQLPHQHGMEGIGKGNVFVSVGCKDVVVALFLGEHNPSKLTQGKRVLGHLLLWNTLAALQVIDRLKDHEIRGANAQPTLFNRS
jgi:hypothetical protein